MKTLALTGVALLLLAGCGDRSAEAGRDERPGAAANATAAPDLAGSRSDGTSNSSSPTATPAPSRATYLGRWRGVEGLNLVVSPRAGADDAVSLAMQWSLDDKGTYDGKVTAEGIVFERNGGRQVLRPSDGAATGLKYLDGKKDCLTVTPGEGYCRD